MNKIKGNSDVSFLIYIRNNYSYLKVFWLIIAKVIDFFFFLDYTIYEWMVI